MVSAGSGFVLIFFNVFSGGILSMNVKIVVLQQASSSFKHYLIN